MQFLKIEKSTTLAQLSSIVGESNVDIILYANQLTRSRNIGEQFSLVCSSAKSGKPVDWKQKATILNTLTGDADAFEYACLQGSDGWKVLAKLGTFDMYLKIPETVKLPDSTAILGGADEGTQTVVYTKVMNSLKEDHTIDPGVFSSYSTIKPVQFIEDSSVKYNTTFQAFNLPWGKITLYSSLADQAVNIPAYPEEISDSISANYTTMPDTIYQYEPWYAYQSSGPRSNSYTFHLHRDMWTGNHLDGNCENLVSFCNANCYPRYSGSSVITSTVTLYLNGKPHISGILTKVDTDWSGPLGQDGFYLELKLTLSITEVATSPKSFDTVLSSKFI